MAVCGLPQPRRQHAVVMARFAQDCLGTLYVLVHELEATLGPDTGKHNTLLAIARYMVGRVLKDLLSSIPGDLQLRVGLHSGPTVRPED